MKTMLVYLFRNINIELTLIILQFVRFRILYNLYLIILQFGRLRILFNFYCS